LLVKAPLAGAQEPDRFLSGSTVSLDLSANGITRSTCFEITEKGEFYIERRIQKLPATIATRTVEQGELTAAQLVRLTQHIQSSDVKALQKFEPEVPAANDRHQVVQLQLSRDGVTQHAGYAIWHGNTPGSKMNTAAIQQAERSKAVLDPIMREIDGLLRGKLLSGDEITETRCR
jgi:hypothetical protein